MNQPRKITHLLLLLFVNATLLQSQNLVPNPGFEEWDGTSGIGANSLSGLFDWYNANGTPDHHHPSLSGNTLTALDPCPLGGGNTNCGYPIDGEAVLGCWKGNGLDGTREWAGVQLLQALTPGACYKVSFGVQNKMDHPDFLYESNQWGIFFSETQVPDFSANVIDYTSRMDQIVMTEEVVGDTLWHYFEFDYQANEAYQYAYIGFQGNVSTATFTAANPDPFLGFYVWFDSISVVKIAPELALTADTTICPGETVWVQANSNFPVSWDHLGPDTTSSFLAAPQASTTYYVRTLDSTACSILDSIVITVDQGEVVALPDSVLICLGTSPFQLEVNTNNSGAWTGPGITDASSGIFDPNLVGEGLHEVVFVSDNDCSENISLQLEILATPLLVLEPDLEVGCIPMEVTFTDHSAITGSQYLWNFGNGQMSTSSMFASTIYEDAGFYEVSLSVTFSEHCSASINYPNMIVAGEAPIADFSVSPNQLSNFEPLAHFENLSNPIGSTWAWQFGDGNTSTQYSPSHEFAQPGIYTVQLQVTTPQGCQDTFSQNLTVANQVRFFVPNAFSPNADGVNDYFEVSPIGVLESYQITIFNRWGGIVFRSTDATSPWDGYVNGETVMDGIYLYVVEYQLRDSNTGTLIQDSFSGDVMVLK